MTLTKAWLHRDDQLPPGKELFRSERRFQMWAYTASHGQLLLRSTPRLREASDDTTIDLLFKPLGTLSLTGNLDGLIIRTASQEEATELRYQFPELHWNGLHGFILESQGRSGYVISAAVGWEEGVLPRMRHSFFHSILPGEKWPARELAGVGAGFEMASAQELLDALSGRAGPRRSRVKCRHLHVLMVKPDPDSDAYAAGAFFTGEDADEARQLFAPKVHKGWIDWVPLAI